MSSEIIRWKGLIPYKIQLLLWNQHTHTHWVLTCFWKKVILSLFRWVADFVSDMGSVHSLVLTIGLLGREADEQLSLMWADAFSSCLSDNCKF